MNESSIMLDNKISQVYTVEDIMSIMCVSKTVAYNLCNDNPPFKVIKIGRLIRVPKSSFDLWLKG